MARLQRPQFITFFLLLLLLPLEVKSVDKVLVDAGNRRVLASKASIGSEKSHEEDGTIAIASLKQKKAKIETVIEEGLKLKKSTNGSSPLLKKKLVLNQTDPSSWKPLKKATDLPKPAAESTKYKTASAEKKIVSTTIKTSSLDPEEVDLDLSEGLPKRKKKVDGTNDVEPDETPTGKKKILDGDGSYLLKTSATKNIKTTVGEKKKVPTITATKASIKQEKIDSSEGLIKKKKIESIDDADTEQPPMQRKKKKIDLLESDAMLKLESPIKKNTTVPTPTKKNLTPSPVKKTGKDSKPKSTAKTRHGLEDDLVGDFRDLPHKLQENFVPDLEIIAATSKAYLSKANREMVEGFKPLVGHTYAPMVATVTSYIFLFLPLLLVSFLFHHIREYLSLQKLLFFVHGYLGAYFTVLTLGFAFFRVEPLRFFYESSLSSYVYMQLMQTLFYVVYLLMLVLYMVVQFSVTATALWVRLAALVQTMVGAIIGLHYYSAVFHNALLHRAPRASWKSHACYALSFLMLSLLAKKVIERSKKVYYHELDNGDKNS